MLRTSIFTICFALVWSTVASSTAPAASTPSIASAQDVVNEYNNVLAKNYKLDTSNRPNSRQNIRKLNCGTGTNRLRERMGYPDTVEVWDWNTLASITQIDIVNHYTTDVGPEINTGPNDSTIKAIMSTAVAQASTEGWVIGGTASLTLGSKDLPSGTVTFSAQHTSTSTTTITETETVEYDATCPAGYTCSIETVTFVANIVGTCYNQTWFDFSGYNVGTDVQLCSLLNDKDGGAGDCPVLSTLYDHVCTHGVGTSQPNIPCEVSTPIWNESGNLLSVVVVTTQKN
ncbi:hypothetical protein BGW36DRAFT_441428 [Talaromyces proteolyticus]|uniref:Ig-like domain-containing protein n=1 Tax=Talaromyces proteolyticus TaxID=1131652 RepID=A0AAD4KII9_9EURO|nr:uncharacterized protein BGW36DRAFT_441428 [Talaromyces proteolyticus]KAH8689315.1 hypothetical protein BGW36DRAFT_441428 [Talaromyces proteolyticus]